jgi:hypothetical protein
MIRFCFLSDIKCIRSINVNKNFLRRGRQYDFGWFRNYYSGPTSTTDPG